MCRGYGDTERPALKEDYQLHLLAQDIAELIPALGYKSCILVGHDWGGMVAWYECMLCLVVKYNYILCRKLIQSRPDLVDRLIIMDCPHFKYAHKNITSENN